MRRILALFLSVIMLFSFIPNRVEGKSYVKDIDVIFGGFQLKVNKKNVVNHKEPFIYGDDLFVGLSDLARGLEMAVNVNGNTANLSSKGKLGFNSNSSNESIVFQRGYEIMAKERIIESLEDEIYSLNNQTTGRIDYKMKSNIKNIKVGFGTVSVYLDGKKLNLDTEPLKYNSDMYVALDSIAPYLYITPSMSKDKTTLNIDANGVLVKDNKHPTVTALLSMREGRNYLLDLQRAELERKKSFMEEFKIPYKKIGNIKSLESYLNKNFNKVGDLVVTFDVVQQSNWINLSISFPHSKNLHWNRLKRSDVEQWIWNIYTAVLNVYDEEVLISGSIRNPLYTNYSSSDLKNYVTFRSKDKDIYFDFTKSKLVVDNRVDPDYLVEVLNNVLPKHLNTNFTYDAKISGANLELIVYPSPDNFSKLSIFMKMGYLKTLNQKIKDLYPDLLVNGKIIFLSDSILPIDFYISENNIRSINLLEETEKYINTNFGYFSYGNDSFKIHHYLNEKDLKNYHLSIETDFSVNDDKWLNTGESGLQRLGSSIQSALGFVLSLWNVNVSTEVVDKNGVLIMDFDSYQENVSIVSATPPSGEILENEKVYLYIDTPGASIYYTLDGSTPTTSSDIFDKTLGIPIYEDTVINAFGYKEGLGAGPVSTFRYTVLENVNLSYGLTNLSVDSGTLNVPFSNSTRNYNVSVFQDTPTIDITPYATNSIITVNGSTVATGEALTIALTEDSTTIRISVKEGIKGEKIYTVVVDKTSGGTNTFDIDNLGFSTLAGLIFNGKIISNNIDDFNNYRVEIFTRSEIPMGSFVTSSNGDFSIQNPNIGWADKISGFKYKIYDNHNIMVLERNLP